MLIHVKRRHIVKGKMGMPRDCPIALAIYEATNEIPTVCNGGIYTGGGICATTLMVRRFIARFDAGKPVKPFAFVLKSA